MTNFYNYFKVIYFIKMYKIIILIFVCLLFYILFVYIEKDIYKKQIPVNKLKRQLLNLIIYQTK